MERRVQIRDSGMSQRESVARVAELNVILDRVRLEDIAVAKENRSRPMSRSVLRLPSIEAGACLLSVRQHFFLSCACAAVVCQRHSVLTHEEILDLLWTDEIRLASEHYCSDLLTPDLLWWESTNLRRRVSRD